MTDKSTSSFRYDEDTIISDIKNIYERDLHIPEFFELLQPEDDYVDERYDNVEEPNDLCTLSDIKKYPECVLQAIYRSEKRVIVGTFINND